MKVLYLILIVTLTVNGYTDNKLTHEINNITEQVLKNGDAPYFVAIRIRQQYICNGVILTSDLVLTSCKSEIYWPYNNYYLDYGMTTFNGKFSPKKTRKIIAQIQPDLRDFPCVLSVLKVHIPFEFGENVKIIKLPVAEQSIPLDQGVLITRKFGNDKRDNCILISTPFPPDSEKLLRDRNVMYRRDNIDVDIKYLMGGSPYVINGTLYGIISMQSLFKNMVFKWISMELINIPNVVQRINNIKEYN